MELAIVFLLVNVFITSTDSIPYRFEVYPVENCPKSKEEFDIAAQERNCTENSRYLCAPNKNLSNLIEFCTDRPRSLFQPGNCVRLEGTGDLNHYKCNERFVSGCPKQPFGDDELYKYPECLNISKIVGCFVADKDCEERTHTPVATTTPTQIKAANATNECSDGVKDPVIAFLSVLVVLLVFIGFIFIILKLKIIKKGDSRLSELERSKERKEKPSEKTEFFYSDTQLAEYLKNGKVTICHAQGIIVGCEGVGKTTLLRLLQDIPQDECPNTAHVEPDNAFSFEVLDIASQGVNKIGKIPIISFHKSEVDQFLNERSAAIKNVTEDENEAKENYCNIDEKKILEQSQVKAQIEDGEGIERFSLSNEEETIPFLNVSGQMAGVNIDKQQRRNQSQNLPQVIHCKKEDSYSIQHDANIESYSITKLTDCARELLKTKATKKRITFIDLAGKSMYYAYHQIYLNPETFYILVVDMEKNLDSPCEMSDVYGSRFESWTYKDHYRFLLKSIDNACNSDAISAVIIVCTYKDGNSETNCRAFQRSFFKLFEKQKDLRRHLHNNRWFSIKILEDEGKFDELTKLQETICSLVNHLPNWKITIKPLWAIFEHILQQKKERKIISKKELLDHNDGLPQEFRLDRQEITEFLLYLNRIGTLLYFEEKGQSNEIILDVQWFVDAYECILEYPVDMENTTDIERVKFYTTGELYDQDLDMIWGRPQNEQKEYIRHKSVLLSHMENLGLLLAVHDCGPRLWYYFPCINGRTFDIQHEQLKKQYAPSSILCFKFDEKKQLPYFVFHHLVIKCLKLPVWKVRLEENTKHSCIYDDAACFSYRKHIVLLCVCKFQIQVQVCHPHAIDPSVLREIRIFLEKALTELKKDSFEIGYKCRKGKFHKEEDTGFIPEKEFPVPVDNQLCDNCGLQTHFVENKICWILADDQRGHFVYSHKIEEMNDEGARSIKHILDACIDGNREDFSFHLKKEIGDRKRLLERPHENGWNVLHYAAKGGDHNIFSTLSKNVDICRKTNDQMNVLHIASKYGHVEICECILESQQFITSLREVSSQGKNACHYAAEGGSLPLLKLLIEKGIDPKVTTSDRKNIFHIACIYSKLEICEFIAEKYQCLVFADDEDKWNAVMYASKNGNTDILQFLNKINASFTHASASDRNALHIACDNGQFEACKFIAENYPSLLNEVDHKGRHAAHFAVRSGNMDTLTYLETKMKVTECTKSKMNILHMACLHCHRKMCEYILVKYPDLNEQVTDNGWTSAHFLAGIGNSKGNEDAIFQMLLQANKKVNIMLLSVKNNSVLTLAIKYNNYDFAEYLLRNHSELLNIEYVNNPWKTGNENKKMESLLEKFLKSATEQDQ